MTWAEQAEELGQDFSELGGAAGELFASAWRARLDLDALGALAGAAVALGQRPAVTRPRRRGEVLPSDREMCERAEDLEADSGDLLRICQQMAAGTQNSWSQACRDLQAARAAWNDAKTGEARGVAEHDAADANARIADCEVAMEIISGITGRLSYAIGCLQRVPDDLATTYEAAYSLRRRGHRLPADGDFLTGTPATPDQPSNAMA